MKRTYIPWQLAVAGALAIQVGCVDADASIRILRNQAPENGCEIPADDGADFLPRGIIDTEAESGYLFTPLVENRGIISAEAERLFFIEGANVDLFFQNGITPPSDEAQVRFRQPLSGSIPAGELATFAFEIVQKPVLEDLAGQLGDGESTLVEVDIEILGEIDGGDASSNLFTYPVDVCKGCLTNVIGSCDALPSVQVRTGGSCQLLQDGVVDCCTDSEGGLVCPAESSTSQ